MEEQKNGLGMLDLLTAPGFCVKENKIIKVNAAAAAANDKAAAAWRIIV